MGGESFERKCWFAFASQRASRVATPFDRFDSTRYNGATVVDACWEGCPERRGRDEER